MLIQRACAFSNFWRKYSSNAEKFQMSVSKCAFLVSEYTDHLLHPSSMSSGSAKNQESIKLVMQIRCRRQDLKWAGTAPAPVPLLPVLSLPLVPSPAFQPSVCRASLEFNCRRILSKLLTGQKPHGINAAHQIRAAISAAFLKCFCLSRWSVSKTIMIILTAKRYVYESACRIQKYVSPFVQMNILDGIKWELEMPWIAT